MTAADELTAVPCTFAQSMPWMGQSPAPGRGAGGGAKGQARASCVSARLTRRPDRPLPARPSQPTVNVNIVEEKARADARGVAARNAGRQQAVLRSDVSQRHIVDGHAGLTAVMWGAVDKRGQTALVPTKGLHRGAGRAGDTGAHLRGARLKRVQKGARRLCAREPRAQWGWEVSSHEHRLRRATASQPRPRGAGDALEPSGWCCCCVAVRGREGGARVSCIGAACQHYGEGHKGKKPLAAHTKVDGPPGAVCDGDVLVGDVLAVEKRDVKWGKDSAASSC